MSFSFLLKRLLPLEKNVSRTKEKSYLSTCLDEELIKRYVCYPCLSAQMVIRFHQKKTCKEYTGTEVVGEHEVV